MWPPPLSDQFAEELFLAGEHVEAGDYRQLGANRMVTMPEDGLLPASCDGRVACYVRVKATWRHLQTGAVHAAVEKQAALGEPHVS